MSSSTRRQLEAWLKKIDVKAENVLDVGGSQLSVKKRVKTWKVDNYKILDLEEPHQGEEPDIIFDLNNFYKLKQFESNFILDELESSFDIAFCLEVAEYWFDPISALKSINYFLKQEGLLYISFPFLYPYHEPLESDYLRYTKYGSIKLLEKAGFEILEITPRVEEASMFRTAYSVEGMRPSKNYKCHNETGNLIKAIKK